MPYLMVTSVRHSLTCGDYGDETTTATVLGSLQGPSSKSGVRGPSNSSLTR